MISCAFICSGLEAGRDGVGDYCRLLAGEMHRTGNAACIVALNDSLATGVIETAEPIPTLRLPGSMPWDERMRKARDFISALGCQWISFQFVSYGFHPKGLVGRFNRDSVELAQGMSVHVMLHELWIGAAQTSTWKARFWGFLQKRSILRWLRQLNPKVIHTTNPSYSYLLEKERIRCAELPLFGNIVVSRKEGGWFNSELAQLGITDANREKAWVLGVFGGIPAEWQPFELFNRLLQEGEKQQVQLVLASIGRHGKAGIIERLAAEFKGRLQVLTLGEQPSERVSDLLHSIDFGLATCPRSLLGKSSATASMIDHGLPVIVSRDDVNFGQPAQNLNAGRFIELDDEFEKWLQAARRQQPHSRLEQIAERFVNSLQEAERN